MITNEIANRFMSHVNTGGECWLWSASCDSDGYGHMWVNGKLVQAHRLAYQLFVGEIPGGALVLHKCDNPSCCNPKHLFIGDQTVNMQDMANKHREPSRKGEKNGRAKITRVQADEIREKYKSGIKQRALAVEYGLSQSAVAYITRGEHWKDGV